MRVNAVMTPVSRTLSPETCVRDAAKAMQSFGVPCLPVEAGSDLIGMVSFKDIALRAVARGRDPISTPIESVMTKRVACCRSDQETGSVKQAMAGGNQEYLAVLDRRDHVVGVVTFDALAPGERDPLPIEETIAAFEEHYGWSERVGGVACAAGGPRERDPLPIERLIAAFDEYYGWSEGD